MIDLDISKVESELGHDAVSSADNARNVLNSRTLKDGAIYLHVRSDYKKATWFCRIKVPGSPGYIYRSCRTTDEHAAYAFASDVYNKALARVLGGATASPKRIAPAVDSYLSHLETDQSRSSVKNKILLLKRLKPALSTKSFEDVSTSLISGLFKVLTDLSAKERLSPNTLRRIASDLKHFFGWCVEQGYIVALPVFPKIAGDASRRTHFDDADWRKLVRHLREFRKHENAAVRRDRSMLTDYVLILGNTGKLRDQLGIKDCKIVVPSVTGCTSGKKQFIPKQLQRGSITGGCGIGTGFERPEMLVSVERHRKFENRGMVHFVG